jgi:membrane fusion protein (multidrug efflux system)
VVQKDVSVYSSGSGLSTATSTRRSARRSRATCSSASTTRARWSARETRSSRSTRETSRLPTTRRKGNVSQYDATLANAKTTVARYTPLARDKAISQQELDDAVTKERTAQANLESAKAALERAKLNLGWTKITSPIEGIAGVAKSQVGDLVGRTTVMTTVSQVDPIRVYFNVSEQEYLAWVAKHGSPERTLRSKENLEKGPLELILADGSKFPHRGRAILLGREIDAKTGTIQIAGVFPNPGDLLRPGQYGKVRVAVDQKKGAILVPQRAVSELQGSYQVAVVGPDNKVTIKVVKTGGTDGNMYVVDEGLKPATASWSRASSASARA